MKYIKHPVALVVAALAMTLAFAGSAAAEPHPAYTQWEGCPSRTVDPNVTVCFHSIVDDGHLQIGDTDTPIVDPITLVGSVAPSGNPDGGVFHLGTFDGGRQEVPGGVIGMTGLDWLINLFPGELLKLYAETELAGTPSSPLQFPFVLPLKVKLENPLLSNTCYIGSNTNPMTLRLTPGTTNPPPPNQPISGSQGHITPDPVLPGVIRIPDNILVDNAFAAPAAQGCGFLGLGVIDAVVNAQAGLPSPAGTNEVIQHADVSLAAVQAVYPPAGLD